LERHITQQWNIIIFFSLQILVPWIFLGNIYEFHAQIPKITTPGINGLIGKLTLTNTNKLSKVNNQINKSK